MQLVFFPAQAPNWQIKLIECPTRACFSLELSTTTATTQTEEDELELTGVLQFLPCQCDLCCLWASIRLISCALVKHTQKTHTGTCSNTLTWLHTLSHGDTLKECLLSASLGSLDGASFWRQNALSESQV